MTLSVKNFSVNSEEDNKSLLRDVSFDVDKGKIHCVLGKNGSGKTTIAHAIMGLKGLSCVGGQILFENQNILEKSTFERARLGITLAFQEPARFEGLSVRDFLRAGNKEVNDKEIEAILKLVGLIGKDFINRLVDEKLSGGERKRIELASVIIMRPKLIILDEPDASLDIIVYNELYDILLRIKQEIGCAILLITHREEAGLIADNATLLEKGRVVITAKFRRVMRTYCQREGKMDRCLAFKNLSRNLPNRK